MAIVTSKNEKILKNYINKCTFSNCVLNYGEITKIDKIVYIQISVTFTTTNEWTTILKLPEKLYPNKSFDVGVCLGNSGAWVYGDGNRAGTVQMAITKDKTSVINVSYLSK